MAPQSLEDRLAAMEAQTKTKPVHKVSLPAAGIGLAFVAAFGAYFTAVTMQKTPHTPLKTSDAQDFQHMFQRQGFKIQP
ncbi:hypothetical protein, partial [Pseudorhodobacter sp.]|uniref:hypothetical protein n=1 Tax=Pseudorhodobacter sp. TaxID=1934400 RepID=UPI002647CBAF